MANKKLPASSMPRPKTRKSRRARQVAAASKAKTMPTDLDKYCKGKRAENNHAKTKELFHDFYEYLQNRKSVPLIKIKEFKSCPIDIYESFYIKGTFPKMNSYKYICLRKYIETNKKMWQSFTASRRVTNRNKDLIAARAELRLIDEGKITPEYKPSEFYLTSSNRIRLIMIGFIKKELGFLKNDPSIERIVTCTELTIAYLVSSGILIKHLKSEEKESLEKSLEEYVKQIMYRFHDIASN